MLIENRDKEIVSFESEIVRTLPFYGDAKKPTFFDTHHISQIKRHSKGIKTGTQISTCCRNTYKQIYTFTAGIT